MAHPKTERTLVVVKPDGIQRALIGEIIKRYERTGFKRPANPAPIRTRSGMKTFAAATPTRWDVAVRVGAAIRSVTNREPGEDRGGTRAGPRPHFRRAHWHTFLHGPGRTERALKWLPPMPINIDDSELPAVLRDVK